MAFGPLEGDRPKPRLPDQREVVWASYPKLMAWSQTLEGLTWIFFIWYWMAIIALALEYSQVIRELLPGIPKADRKTVARDIVEPLLNAWWVCIPMLLLLMVLKAALESGGVVFDFLAGLKSDAYAVFLMYLVMFWPLGWLGIVIFKSIPIGWEIQGPWKNLLEAARTNHPFRVLPPK